MGTDVEGRAWGKSARGLKFFTAEGHIVHWNLNKDRVVLRDKCTTTKDMAFCLVNYR